MMGDVLPCSVRLGILAVALVATHPALADDVVGAALKTRERAFLLGTESRRSSLLAVPGQVEGLTPSPSDFEDDRFHSALPQSLSISVGDLAERVGGGASKLSSGILDFWIEGHYEPYESGSSLRLMERGAMSLVSAGTSYKLGPDIMIGAVASHNQGALTDERLRSDAETSGWAAGPFASVRLGSGVVFDGRMAWGDGTLEERGHVVTSYDGAFDRTLVKGALRGARDVGGWSLTPVFGFTLIEELASGDVRALSREGRVDVTPELKRRLPVSSSLYLEPSVAAGAFLSLGGERDAYLVIPSARDVQLKASAGLAMGVTDGMTVKAQGGVETAGPELPDIWSGRLQLNMPLGK